MLVLADKFSTEPVKEDLSNIMRVISMKNYSESTRCIVQLLYYSSKVGEKGGGFQTNSEVCRSIFNSKENWPCLTFKYQAQPPCGTVLGPGNILTVFEFFKSRLRIFSKIPLICVC